MTLPNCIKALRGVDAGIPYAFDKIKNALRKEVGVEVDQCAEYLTVDAVRILNNSFKHNKGRYQPKDGKPHTRIDEAILKKWSILGEHNEIDYSKLPVKELVVACNGFCADLLDRVENQLELKVERAK